MRDAEAYGYARGAWRDGRAAGWAMDRSARKPSCSATVPLDASFRGRRRLDACDMYTRMWAGHGHGTWGGRWRLSRVMGIVLWSAPRARHSRPCACRPCRRWPAMEKRGWPVPCARSSEDRGCSSQVRGDNNRVTVFKLLFLGARIHTNKGTLSLTGLYLRLLFRIRRSTTRAVFRSLFR